MGKEGGPHSSSGESSAYMFLIHSLLSLFERFGPLEKE